ncbi:MAG TPA: DUF507 family protein [Candidatus Binatia bacterium]
MTRLSENRVSHLSRLILDGLKKGGAVTFRHEGRALSETKQALSHFFERDDHLDSIVRQKIQSLSRHVPQGSREWDVLYRKYMEEELRKERK